MYKHLEVRSKAWTFKMLKTYKIGYKVTIINKHKQVRLETELLQFSSKLNSYMLRYGPNVYLIWSIRNSLDLATPVSCIWSFLWEQYPMCFLFWPTIEQCNYMWSVLYFSNLWHWLLIEMNQCIKKWNDIYLHSFIHIMIILFHKKKNRKILLTISTKDCKWQTIIIRKNHRKWSMQV